MLDYYTVNKEASLKVDNHEGLLYVQAVSKLAGKVLDVGCGEGSRLQTLLPKNKIGWGIDISKDGIALAKSHYPKHHWQVANAENLPFEDQSFDLVYTAFAIEHCQHPKKFVDEIRRVCKPGGQIVILCPNYGAPNRRSPVSLQNPISKLFFGFIKDFWIGKKLNWQHVVPKKVFEHIDADTTVEPYAKSLKSYLIAQKMEIRACSTLWALEPKTNNPRKWITKELGIRNVTPFKYWGPQIFIAAQKPYLNKQ